MGFNLEFLDNGQTRTFSFEQSNVSIGRDKAADFVLDHPTVSRQHAIIRLDPTGPKLVVLSKGGLTAVNGQQVHGEVALVDGSHINLGQLAFTFRGAQSAQPAQQQAQQQPQTQQPQQQPQQQQQQSGWEPGVDAWSDGAAFDQPGDRVGRKRQADAPPEPKEEFPDPNTGGIQTWDEIAAGDNEDHEDFEGQTNFQRLQAAQRKANKQSQGTNPVLAVGAVLIGAALMAYSFWPQDFVIVEPKLELEEGVEIKYQPGDIKCSVAADCTEQAVQLYMYASETFDKREVAISNLYLSYAAMDKATELLKMGGVTSPVPELEGLDKKKDEALTLMNDKFRQIRINFNQFQKRKMYVKMADTLDIMKAYFPDKRHSKHMWAIEQERAMRDAGIYPRRGKK